MVSSPKAPDPYAQAAAQQGAELGAAQGSAIINNPNEVNPYGSVSYKNLGYETIYDAKGKPQYVPRYERNVQLSPDQMKLLGLQTQAQYNLGQTGVQQSAKLNQLLGTSLDTSGLQGWNTGQTPGQIRQDQGPTDRAAIEEALMGRYRENAGKQSAAEDAQLAARGLNPGSAQYSSVADTRARALTDASQQAYLASGQESRAAQDAYNQAALQKYQMGSDYAGFQNQLRQAQLQEAMVMRNQPLNEISALMSGSQVTVPEFSPFSRQGINAAPVGQYIGQNYANAANAAANANQGLFGLGSSLIGGAFSMSDRSLKQDIEPLGGMLAGVPLYRFHFKGQPEPRAGVMADEVRPLHPDAVIEVDGFDAVDYGLLVARQSGGLSHGF
ncbi:tail fiber domain-containing protein [Mesorhizobium sp.]|uniref:tail fiber domain-containing protein n=1 Tax=Mesorhizobium sp. TaxID=1871066 RepID=UPI000FEA641E|nr:tail fiber domain-containing protein [Mesorhizobium sp.]RWP05101.1 MAG: tail fiber domain-containing protein [Mesorhizobium sp.]